MGNRAETVRALLETATIGSLEHVALLLVQALEYEAKPFIEKLRLLWCTPSPHDILSQWKLSDWIVYAMFMESYCRNDWDGLNPNALNMISLAFAWGMRPLKTSRMLP